MTLLELQGILGDNINAVNDLNAETADPNVVKAIYGKADSIARLSKQMINNADVVLRKDKLMAEGKITKDDAISRLVGA